MQLMTWRHPLARRLANDRVVMPGWLHAAGFSVLQRKFRFDERLAVRGKRHRHVHD